MHPNIVERWRMRSCNIDTCQFDLARPPRGCRSAPQRSYTHTVFCCIRQEKYPTFLQLDFFCLVYSLVCKGSKHATLVLYFSIDTLFFPLAYNLRVWNCCEHLMAVYPTTTPCFKLVSAHMFACHRTRPSVPHAKGPSATDALTFRYQHTAP